MEEEKEEEVVHFAAVAENSCTDEKPLSYQRCLLTGCLGLHHWKKRMEGCFKVPAIGQTDDQIHSNFK
jgi:hypothetical protein